MRTIINQHVDERLKLAIESGDPDLVYDLRELNLGHHSKYDEFWEGLQEFLDRDFPPVVDERRHGEVEFLPVAVSIKDLIEKVKEVEFAFLKIWAEISTNKILPIFVKIKRKSNNQYFYVIYYASLKRSGCLKMMLLKLQAFSSTIHFTFINLVFSDAHIPFR